jgi:hypothetical protein
MLANEEVLSDTSELWLWLRQDQVSCNGDRFAGLTSALLSSEFLCYNIITPPKRKSNAFLQKQE